MIDAGSQRKPACALYAEEAGRYLAAQLGLPSPLTKQRMWELARRREGGIPVVRVGRRVVFQVVALDEFVARGGTPRTDV